jgi:hypothetical protein
MLTYAVDLQTHTSLRSRKPEFISKKKEIMSSNSSRYVERDNHTNSREFEHRARFQSPHRKTIARAQYLTDSVIRKARTHMGVAEDSDTENEPPTEGKAEPAVRNACAVGKSMERDMFHNKESTSDKDSDDKKPTRADVDFMIDKITQMAISATDEKDADDEDEKSFPGVGSHKSIFLRIPTGTNREGSSRISAVIKCAPIEFIMEYVATGDEKPLSDQEKDMVITSMLAVLLSNCDTNVVGAHYEPDTHHFVVTMCNATMSFNELPDILANGVAGIFFVQGDEFSLINDRNARNIAYTNLSGHDCMISNIGGSHWDASGIELKHIAVNINFRIGYGCASSE